MAVESGLTPVRCVSRDVEPLIHLGNRRADPPFSRSLCGKPRDGVPLKPGAEVTCVVCLDLKAGRHG